MNDLIEIRSLNIKPGEREKLHRLYIEEALSMLKRWNRVRARALTRILIGLERRNYAGSYLAT